MEMTEQEKIERIEKMRKLHEDIKLHYKERMIEQIKNMKPFVTVDDIPEPPIVDKETRETIVIPNYIRCGAIPKKDLVVGAFYLGDTRNASSAVWNGEEFEHYRYKWGLWSIDTVKHFEDDDDDGYAVFVPIKLVEKEELEDGLTLDKIRHTFLKYPTCKSIINKMDCGFYDANKSYSVNVVDFLNKMTKFHRMMELWSYITENPSVNNSVDNDDEEIDDPTDCTVDMLY